MQEEKRTEKLDVCKTYTVKNPTVFLNERNQCDQREFVPFTIRTQIEGQHGKTVVIRGKYPYDAYFVTTTTDNLVLI